LEAGLLRAFVTLNILFTCFMRFEKNQIGGKIEKLKTYKHLKIKEKNCYNTYNAKVEIRYKEGSEIFHAI
jgi:hypothetical protein